MAQTSRRTATYDAAVIEAAERARTSSEYRRALAELSGDEPTTESAVFNALAKVAIQVVERRALEIGYRRLAETGELATDDVDVFLEQQALVDFDYDEDEDSGPLLRFLAEDAP